MIGLDRLDDIHRIERAVFILRGRCDAQSSDVKILFTLCRHGFPMGEAARLWEQILRLSKLRGQAT